MKTSFYFFLWIIIYPLLGLLHNPWIDSNSFIIALFIVWGLSWILNKNMPNTLKYERIVEITTIMEEVFTGNIKAFMRRLSRMVAMDFITAIYLGVAFVYVLFSMVRGSAEDWIALLIFGFFALGAITRAVKLNQVYNRIKQNPTKEECADIIAETYRVDYQSYYNARLNSSVQAMLPPRPLHFTAFQVFSLIIAIICALLGLYYLIMAIIILSTNGSAAALSGGIMYFLYGSLASYFGIKDTYSCINYFRRKYS